MSTPRSSPALLDVPPESVDGILLLGDGELTSWCPGKGTTSYKDVVVDGEVNRNAARCYREPSRAATEIADY